MAGVEFREDGIAFAEKTEKPRTDVPTKPTDPVIARSVRQSVKEQEEREAATHAEHPDAYRVSEASDEELQEKYRRGKENMGADDLIDYFSETRAEHIRNTDFSAEAGENGDTEQTAEEDPLPAVRGIREPTVAEKIRELPQKIKTLPTETKQYVKTALPTWFDARRADTSHEIRRIPVSAFAALIAVAISLMLIVSGSVLVTKAESRLNDAADRVSDLNDEITELRSKLDVSCDLLALRALATEEYGMVSREYVRMTYLPTGNPDSIESARSEEEKNRIPTLLKVLGAE